jgi:hypothetical protein
MRPALLDERTQRLTEIAVATLRRLGIRGCAAQMAGEFGNHPDTALSRMAWALATIRTVYPVPSMTPALDLHTLALAS